MRPVSPPGMPNTNSMPASSRTRTTAWGASISSGIMASVLNGRDLPAASALDGACGETRDVVLHEERVDEGDGNGAQQRPGHQLTPVEGVAADQLAHDADR